MIQRRKHLGPLKNLQELRGLLTHYTNCDKICETLAHPSDALLAYPDESSLMARCEGSELRPSFWNMIKFIGMVLGKKDGRTKLRDGS